VDNALAPTSDRAPLRLYTIPISHYCEKVRWALDHYGTAFEERRHLQGFHYPYARFYGGGPMVPVLVDGATRIADSTAILQYLDRHAPPELRLYPEDATARADVESLETLFDEGVGVEGRRWMYSELFSAGAVDKSWLCDGIPRFEAMMMEPLFFLGRRFITARLNVSDETVAAGHAVIDHALSEVERRLADGRRYLTGDRFTAADLTFACMASPLLGPTRYGSRLPEFEDFPPGVQARLTGYRATPAGAFALRLFEEDRPEPTTGGAS